MVPRRAKTAGQREEIFYSRFVEAMADDPEFIGKEQVLALTVANMFAGSDASFLGYPRYICL